MDFIGPISFRKRDRRVAQLIRKGSATDDEIFAAQFGEWPAKGLHQDTPRPDVVSFKGYFSGTRGLLEMPFTMAYANPNNDDRAIHINRLTLNPAAPVLGILTSRMAFARAHDILEPLLGIEFLRMFAVAAFALSGFSSYRYAVASSLSKLLAPSVSDIIGEEHIHILQFKDGSDITARRAFLNDARNILANRTGLYKLGTDVLQGLDMLLTLMPREHYAQDHEQQARLHNLIVRGYKAWGKIPETEDELIAALADMGIMRPKIVYDYLKDDGQINVCATFNKNAQTGYVAAPAGEMNLGLNTFRSSEVLLRFWKDYLPLLYADLLVKYGDSKGFERMGYTGETDIMGLPVRTAPSPLAFNPNSP
ncbi:MAG: hypothetical protein H6865_04930 [Rhodospirillales bacterium]|nr:hypothetical protein [Alphaproteobacteria bacterium]MCB9986962.1 hypothetical protein [Rhodospirillales bacterium]USO08263.1 MAG: hypothetical protein H6866_03360 [Rhodospirillales bacterium]